MDKIAKMCLRWETVKNNKHIVNDIAGAKLTMTMWWCSGIADHSGIACQSAKKLLAPATIIVVERIWRLAQFVRVFSEQMS